MNEQDLQYGDSCDVLCYSSGSLSGRYDVVTCGSPLEYGVWDLEYGHEQGGGLSSVRLVYAENLSPVPTSNFPSQVTLTGVYPNPFNPQIIISYELPYNGRDRSGRQLSSGTYLLRMQANDFQATKRLTLVR